MEHYFILNLFVVVTVLSVCYPTEVQGYESSDYPTRSFYNYPWRRFNHLKTMETDVKRNGQEFGDVLRSWSDNSNSNFTNYPIFPKYDDEHESKKSSTNKKRLSNVTPVYGIKVLYGRVPPGTVIVWPSSL